MHPHLAVPSLLCSAGMELVPVGARFTRSGATTLFPWTPYLLVVVSGKATPPWALACCGTR